MAPPMRYARCGDLSIAYQTLGEGPDLVLVPGFVTHLDLAWEEPRLARFLRGLASFGRLIWFDRRGTGLSDPAAGPLTLSAAVDDVCAVLRAAGSSSASLFGVAVGSAICTAMALARPDEVRSLVLWGAHARLLRAPGYPAGWTEEFFDEIVAGIEADWTTGRSAAVMNPSVAVDERYRDWFLRNARAAASPAQARELFHLCAAVDLRTSLGAVRTPTLLLHRRDDPWLSVEHSRYVAAHLPAARLVELAGVDHWPWIGDQDAVLDEVAAFLTGSRRARLRRPAWGPDALTARERQVLSLVVEGRTSPDIGATLCVSERTVETHIASAYRKLGVTSRVELGRRAREFDL